MFWLNCQMFKFTGMTYAHKCGINNTHVYLVSDMDAICHCFCLQQ